MELLDKFPVEGGQKDPKRRIIPFLPGNGAKQCPFSTIKKENDKNLLISASFPFVLIPFGILITISWAKQASWRSSLVSWFRSFAVWLIRNICVRCVKMRTTMTQWSSMNHQEKSKYFTLRRTNQKDLLPPWNWSQLVTTTVVLLSPTLQHSDSWSLTYKRKLQTAATVMSWRLGSAAPLSWLSHHLV